MVDFESGVYAGNTAKCGSGVPSTVACTASGANPNPTVTFNIVTTLFKHNGTSRGTGGFSEGGVIAGETNDETDDAIQRSIACVYGK